MSRIGKEPVALPAGVTAKVDGQKVTVKGKLGELAYVMHDGITAKVAHPQQRGGRVRGLQEAARHRGHRL